MALNARKAPKGNGGGPKQEPIDPGSYPCRLVQVLDLGIQEQRPYQGQEKPPAHEIMLTYEFLDEFCVDEDGNELEDKPRWLSETLPLRNLENEKAKSTKRYYALDPKEDHGGDFIALLGTPCNVEIVQNPGKGKHAGKVFTNIANVSTMRPKDAKNAAELVNDPKAFSIDVPDMEVFFSLPDWVQDKIKSNLEYAGSELEELVEAGPAAKEEDEEEEAPRKPKRKPAPAADEDEEDDDEWV